MPGDEHARQSAFIPSACFGKGISSRPCSGSSLKLATGEQVSRGQGVTTSFSSESLPPPRIVTIRIWHLQMFSHDDRLSIQASDLYPCDKQRPRMISTLGNTFSRNQRGRCFLRVFPEFC